MSDFDKKIVAVYSYRDAAGQTSHEVVRYDPKGFRQRRPDPSAPGGYVWSVKGVEPLPYRLPEISAAIADGQTIVLVEGEKDADRLASHGFAATTILGGGARGWAKELTPYFAGADVVIIPDNDETGEKFLNAAGRALRGEASVRVLRLEGLPARGDVSDFLDAGGDVESLRVQIREAPEWRPEPPALGAGFTFLEDVQLTSDTEWLIPGWVPKDGLSLVYGEPGSGKSFLALDLGVAVASGRDFFGREPLSGGVIYVAAEGAGGVRKRLVAAKKGHPESEQSPFLLDVETRNLLDPRIAANAIARLLKAVEHMEAVTGEPVRLIIIDTLSRVITGGDENSAKDMSALIANFSELAAHTGAHVLVVHHKGKERTDPRGHSSLLAAVDTALEVTNEDGARAVTVKKQKDGEDGQKLAFSLDKVDLGTNADGEEISSCVVTPQDAPPKSERSRPRPKSDVAQFALKILHQAIAEHGQRAPGGVPERYIPKGVKVVSWDLWRTIYERRRTEKDPSRSFRRHSLSLQNDGFIQAWEDGDSRLWVWPTHPPEPGAFPPFIVKKGRT